MAFTSLTLDERFARVALQVQRTYSSLRVEVLGSARHCRSSGFATQPRGR